VVRRVGAAAVPATSRVGSAVLRRPPTGGDRRPVGLSGRHGRVARPPWARAVEEGDRAMNNDELAVSIERSVAQRVAGIAPRPDAQELLTRLERRNVRQRRRLTAAAALFLVVGGVAGYVFGNSGGDSGS